jgi:hypothetical protein
MKRLLQISILILLISCKAKQTVIYDVKPSIRPQFEKRIPTKKDLPIVETFFSDWANEYSAISDTEYNNLDSISKLGYEVFESLYIDTCFIGLKLDKLNAKYILIPNQIRIGIADSVRKDLGFVFYDNINQLVLDDFRPRISIISNQTLYYTKVYQDTLPDFAERFGVGGFIKVDSYLMSNYPRYLETAPVIRGIIYLRKMDEYCIEYETGSNCKQLPIPIFPRGFDQFNIAI